MNGRRAGVFGAGARAALSLASVPYRLAVSHRNRGFDTGRRTVHECGVPVISVGNLTTGGTGKTHVVAFLARWFRIQGVRVAIVSRGYGRGDADENDEAAELYQRLPDVPHVQDPDRVKAAQIAVDELGSQVILMDDGFQHRRLARDLDIVLIDMTCPFGFGHLLPRGLLREPVENLQRCDVVLLTRCDQVTAQEIDAVTEKIKKIHPSVIVLRCSHRPSTLLQYPSTTTAIEAIEGKRVALISGIGNPDAFRRTVEDAGAKVVSHKVFPDHAAYDREQVEAIRDWCATLKECDELICTQKDLVKLRTDRFAGRRLRALVIEAEIDSLDQLGPMLESIVDRIQPG